VGVGARFGASVAEGAGVTPGAAVASGGDDMTRVGSGVSSGVAAGVAAGVADGATLPPGAGLALAGGGTAAVVKFAQRYSRTVSFEAWMRAARSRPTYH